MRGKGPGEPQETSIDCSSYFTYTDSACPPSTPVFGTPVGGSKKIKGELPPAEGEEKSSDIKLPLYKLSLLSC